MKTEMLASYSTTAICCVQALSGLALLSLTSILECLFSLTHLFCMHSTKYLESHSLISFPSELALSTLLEFLTYQFLARYSCENQMYFKSKGESVVKYNKASLSASVACKSGDLTITCMPATTPTPKASAPLLGQLPKLVTEITQLPIHPGMEE